MRAPTLVCPIVAALVLSGCSGDTSLPFEADERSSPAGISLDRTSLQTAVGDTARLRVVRHRVNGVTATEPVEWQVADPSIAGVEDGLVFPLAPGRTHVTASVNGQQVTAAVVTAGRVTVQSVQISPDTAKLSKGQATLLDVAITYSNGLELTLRTSPNWKSLNSAIAKVSKGKLTAVADGQTKIVASLGGYTDTIAVIVGGATPTPPPPPAPVPPPPPGAAGYVVPELPREYLDTTMPAVAGRSIRVPAGANLQAALDAAQPGDELVLDARATYVGTLTLRKKAGNAWITIRSSGALPPEGTRVMPSHANQMARLVAKHPSKPVIDTDAGAHHYRLVGLEVTTEPSATDAGALVSLGGPGSVQKTYESQPHHLVLDRMYIHGTPELDFQRCIALNSASTAIIDSWISECHGKGYDSQAIGGWNGTGPYKIVNNRLEGAGENVMFGGANPAIPGALPSDIEIRRNHFIKPADWEGKWTVKNLLEFKIGRRVLVEGNVLENSWKNAQTGFAINLKSTNQTGNAPWSETSDLTFRHNVIRNSAHGVSMAGQPESHPAVPASRILFEHNVFERIGSGDYEGGRLFQVSGVADLTLSHNTALSTHSFIILAGGKMSPRLTVLNNIFGATSTGITSDGQGYGSKGLDAKAPQWVVRGNIIAGMQADLYPAGNSYPATNDAIGFVNFRAGNFALASRTATSPGANFAAILETIADAIR